MCPDRSRQSVFDRKDYKILGNNLHTSAHVILYNYPLKKIQKLTTTLFRIKINYNAEYRVAYSNLLFRQIS